MRQEKIAEFDCVVQDGDSQTTILIFHGYGADNNDLAPLSQAIKTNGSCRWVFPNGPLEVPIGPGWMGRAWFPIEMEALEKAMAAGTYREMADYRPQHLEVVRKKALQLVETLIDEPGDLVIGGFSQGAMLALDVALNMSSPPKGIVLWSGTIVNQQEWGTNMAKLKSVPVYQSHGSTDPLLDPKAAQKLHELMKTSGLKAQFTGFQGGHEIPVDVIQKTSEFLQPLT